MIFDTTHAIHDRARRDFFQNSPRRILMVDRSVDPPVAPRGDGLTLGGILDFAAGRNPAAIKIALVRKFSRPANEAGQGRSKTRIRQETGRGAIASRPGAPLVSTKRGAFPGRYPGSLSSNRLRSSSAWRISCAKRLAEVSGQDSWQTIEQLISSPRIT